jgi:hypothetical protein
VEGLAGAEGTGNGGANCCCVNSTWPCSAYIIRTNKDSSCKIATTPRFCGFCWMSYPTVGCQKSESVIEVEFPASNGDWGFVSNPRLHKWAQSYVLPMKLTGMCTPPN